MHNLILGSEGFETYYTSILYTYDARKKHKIDFGILIIIQINGNKYGYRASTTSLNIYYVRYIKIQSTENQNFCLRIELCGEGKPYYYRYRFFIEVNILIGEILVKEMVILVPMRSFGDNWKVPATEVGKWC